VGRRFVLEYKPAALLVAHRLAEALPFVEAFRRVASAPPMH
jgi:hypothetical protein